MLQHLATATAGPEATDIVSLFLNMQAWWEEDPHVPEYINRLEDARRRRLTVPASPSPTSGWLLLPPSLSSSPPAFPPNVLCGMPSSLPPKPGRPGSSGPVNHSSPSSANSELQEPVATPLVQPRPPSSTIVQQLPPASLEPPDVP
jgi:hypothetical protein